DRPQRGQTAQGWRTPRRSQARGLESFGDGDAGLVGGEVNSGSGYQADEASGGDLSASPVGSEDGKDATTGCGERSIGRDSGSDSARDRLIEGGHPAFRR